MDYWKNYLGIFLKEEDVGMAKMMRAFVEKEIMPVRQQIDDDKEHTLINRILQGLTKVGYAERAFSEGIRWACVLIDSLGCRDA